MRLNDQTEKAASQLQNDQVARKKINLFQESDEWKMGYNYAQSDPESARYSSTNKQREQGKQGGSVSGEKASDQTTKRQADDAEENWDIYAAKTKSRSSKRRNSRRKRYTSSEPMYKKRERLRGLDPWKR